MDELIGEKIRVTGDELFSCLSYYFDFDWYMEKIENDDSTFVAKVTGSFEIATFLRPENEEILNSNVRYGEVQVQESKARERGYDSALDFIRENSVVVSDD